MPAKQPTRFQIDRVFFIAGKPCSHRALFPQSGSPHGHCVLRGVITPARARTTAPRNPTAPAGVRICAVRGGC
ncbi:hypothetical protein DZG01_06010 [Pseudomonas fluorescens]|nr:hypothetical protein DZG01_06010 [Pseudomonas fluorescens]